MDLKEKLMTDYLLANPNCDEEAGAEENAELDQIISGVRTLDYFRSVRNRAETFLTKRFMIDQDYARAVVRLFVHRISQRKKPLDESYKRDSKGNSELFRDIWNIDRFLDTRTRILEEELLDKVSCMKGYSEFEKGEIVTRVLFQVLLNPEKFGETRNDLKSQDRQSQFRTFIRDRLDAVLQTHASYDQKEGFFTQSTMDMMVRHNDALEIKLIQEDQDEGAIGVRRAYVI